MKPKELITKIKEYADVADATYAMLHYIEENDKPEGWMDKKLNLLRKPPARWIYADGVKRGYEIEKDIESLGRKQGQPTAYALAIEANFSEKKFIKLDENEAPKKIDNEIQNFIKRDEAKPALENQEIKVSTAKEKMPEEQTSHYLSYRTKAFTSRYELLHHQKNTSLGYSATLFLDTWAKSEEEKYILAFRGTEINDAGDLKTDSLLGNIHPSLLKEIFSKQMIVTMTLIEKKFHFFKDTNNEQYKALVSINPQVASLVEHREIVFEIMRNLTKKEEFKLNIVGHSLGGNVAQQRAS